MPRDLPWLSGELQQRADDGLLRRRRETRWLPGGLCEINGRTVCNFIANDYLNLVSDPRVIHAAESALHETGVGARASALLGGRSAWHVRLERRLAEFENAEAAILFPSGMAANVGTVSALVSDQDVVFCDRFNHASLIDGCRLSGAKFRVYRHDDLEGLERELAKVPQSKSLLPRHGGEGGRRPDEGIVLPQPLQNESPVTLTLSPAAGARGQEKTKPRTWIVTDGVFSMDGDLAPLPDLCKLAERYGAEILVDEAHATGVFGTQGRGVAEHFGLENRIAVRIGTLSKAIGCLGGFVAGSQTLIDFLWNSARTQIYSTALPPAMCAAAERAVDILQQEPDRRTRLHHLSHFLRQRLAECGVDVLSGSTGSIIPIVVGDSARAVAVAEQLEQRGFLVGAIRPPTVPRGTARLRISICTAHAEKQLADLAVAIGEELRQEQGHARNRS